MTRNVLIQGPALIRGQRNRQHLFEEFKNKERIREKNDNASYRKRGNVVRGALRLPLRCS